MLPATQRDAEDKATFALMARHRLTAGGHTVERVGIGWVVLGVGARPSWFAAPSEARRAAALWAQRVGWERVLREV